jgi:hypothetical protein
MPFIVFMKNSQGIYDDPHRTLARSALTARPSQIFRQHGRGNPGAKARSSASDSSLSPTARRS